MKVGLQDWPVGELDAIAEPGALEFRVGDADWPFRGLVVRWQGELMAFENVCPHARHPLNLSEDRFFNSEQTLLICASHGALFEPKTGSCVAGPCVGQALRKLDCRVEEGTVYVRAPHSRRTPL